MYSILADILIATAGIFTVLFVWYVVGFILESTGALVYFDRKCRGTLKDFPERARAVLCVLTIFPAGALFIIVANAYSKYFKD